MQAKANSQSIPDFPTARVEPIGSTSASGGLSDSVRDLLQSIPNGIVLAIVGIGVVAEMVALFQIDHPLMRAGWGVAILTPVFIAWFWLTIGLCLHRFSRVLVEPKVERSLPESIMLYCGFFVAFAVLVGMYATSWGLFLKTSRFANWEVLRFSIQNVGELAKYVTAAEPIHLLYGGSVLVVVSAILWMLLKPLSVVRHPAADRPLCVNRIWFLATTLALTALAVVQHCSNADISHRDMLALKHGLNPVVTIIGTGFESLLLDSIDQVIENPENELTPLTSNWSPGLSVQSGASQLPSIIMIQVESLRDDVVDTSHQGREVMPHLNRLAGRSLVWKNAYAHSTHSDYADPCIVSSLYPLRTRIHHYYTKTDPWPRQLSYDCLKQAGYATATISSQNEMWSGMDYFLDSPNLDYFYHPERATDAPCAETSEKDSGFYRHLESGVLKAGKFPDRHTADVAIEWIKQTKTEKPFLLNMNLQSSHFPYLIPKEAEAPFQPCEIPANASFAWYEPTDTEAVRNAYYNALHEIDAQLGRLIEALRETSRLSNTILVVLGENGESFHENGQVCHANKPYEPAIHIATVMYGPKWLGAGEEDYPLEHVDILPTLFGRIGIKPHPNFQGIDALADDRPELKERFLFCHTLSPFSEVDSLQWAGRWKFMRDNQLGQTELYDLANDPKENSNLIDKFPDLAEALSSQLKKWRTRQLAWYHYPQLYNNFYPPAAPKPNENSHAVLEKFLSYENTDE